jgi:hypothetical protein
LFYNLKKTLGDWFLCAMSALFSGKLAIHAENWLRFAVQNAESAYATNAISH